MSQLPYVAQYRNGLICHYKDVSLLEIRRNGCKDTLVQNQDTQYYKVLKDLKSTEKTDDINSYAQSVVNLKKLHDEELLKKIIDKKVRKELYYADENSDYFKQEYERRVKKREKEDKLNVTPLGQVSPIQISKIRCCLENMVNYIYINYDKKIDYKHQQFATFLTLTLPSKQVHTDKVIRKCLLKYIDNLRKNYKVKFYVWKAETQQNGNIHFHLLIDRFIPYNRLRKLWNTILQPLGYIEQYKINQEKRGFLYRETIIKNKKVIKNPKTYKEQYLTYQKAKKNGFKNPNTTDVKSLSNIGSPIAYMLKYMTKNEENKRPVIGKLWGASNLVKKLEYFSIDDTNPMYWNFFDNLDKKDLKFKPINDYLGLFLGKVFSLIQNKFKKLWKQIKNHYNQYKNIQLTVKQKVKEIIEPKQVPKIQVPLQLSFF